MSNLTYIVLSPALLIVSVPLSIFAAFTTTFAFSILFVRVLIVYAELAAVLVRNQLFQAQSSDRVLQRQKSNSTTTDEKETRRKSRRSSAGSGQSSGGSMTPKAPESNGLGIYASGGVERDFEGVGGWRIPGSDDDDILWTSMNSRLELPAIVDERKRNHRRSLTSGSLSSMPLLPRSSTRSLVRTPTSLYGADTASQEGYFSNRRTSKSTTDLDTVSGGKPSLSHKTSSISSFSMSYS